MLVKYNGKHRTGTPKKSAKMCQMILHGASVFAWQWNKCTRIHISECKRVNACRCSYAADSTTKGDEITFSREEIRIMWKLYKINRIIRNILKGNKEKYAWIGTQTDDVDWAKTMKGKWYIIKKRYSKNQVENKNGIVTTENGQEFIFLEIRPVSLSL